MIDYLLQIGTKDERVKLRYKRLYMKQPSLSVPITEWILDIHLAVDCQGHCHYNQLTVSRGVLEIIVESAILKVSYEVAEDLNNFREPTNLPPLYTQRHMYVGVTLDRANFSIYGKSNAREVQCKNCREFLVICHKFIAL